MSLRVSYSPNYYSLDDILATQERVPCKVALTIQKMGKYIFRLCLKYLCNFDILGHLNPSAAERDLQPGTSLELPLWLVSELSQSRAPLVNPELPKIYREAYREILKADACAVDLHKFSLFFYELGSHIKRFDKKQDVHETLLHVSTFFTTVIIG